MSYKAKIVTAIQDLKDRTGSSAIAIKKHIMHANPEMNWMNSVFLTTLKKSVADKDFIQIKGSYKLSPEYKKKLADALKPKKPKKKRPHQKKQRRKRKWLQRKRLLQRKKLLQKLRKRRRRRLQPKRRQLRKQAANLKRLRRKLQPRRRVHQKRKLHPRSEGTNIILTVLTLSLSFYRRISKHQNHIQGTRDTLLCFSKLQLKISRNWLVFQLFNLYFRFT
mmetsp:Transcript_14832/g.32885  ORF Transcript_14832/g.32885 Transcript_14832/m.32885 type:complete len:221 (+) Transcript_14832:101-763(+)